jgi:hypothetical protein
MFEGDFAVRRISAHAICGLSIYFVQITLLYFEKENIQYTFQIILMPSSSALQTICLELLYAVCFSLVLFPSHLTYINST